MRKSKAIPQTMQALQCPDCGRDFEVPEHFSSEEPLVCPDCHKGFETWRGAKGEATTEKDYEKEPPEPSKKKTPPSDA